MAHGIGQYQNPALSPAYAFDPTQLAGITGRIPGVGLCDTPAPRMLTIPDRLEAIEGSLYELVNTLARAEDSLIGPRPCDPANKAGNMPSVDSSLLRITRQLELAHESANSIHRQIVRQ